MVPLAGTPSPYPQVSLCDGQSLLHTSSEQKKRITNREEHTTFCTISHDNKRHIPACSVETQPRAEPDQSLGGVVSNRSIPNVFQSVPTLISDRVNRRSAFGSTSHYCQRIT